MSETLFKKIVLELEDLHFTGIFRPHFYNEPLLDERLPDLIQFTKRHLPYCRIHLFSNGDFLTDQSMKTLIAAGVDEFHVTGHEGVLRNHIKILADKTEYKNILRTYILHDNMELSNRGGHVSVPKMITAKTCNLSKDYLFIDYKGNVILCCNDYLSSTVFGNLAKEQIIDIWTKKEYRFIRYSTKQGLFLLEICKRCMGLSNPNQPPAIPRQGGRPILA